MLDNATDLVSRKRIRHNCAASANRSSSLVRFANKKANPLVLLWEPMRLPRLKRTNEGTTRLSSHATSPAGRSSVSCGALLRRMVGIRVHILLPLKLGHLEKIVDRNANLEAINSLATLLSRPQFVD